MTIICFVYVCTDTCTAPKELLRQSIFLLGSPEMFAQFNDPYCKLKALEFYRIFHNCQFSIVNCQFKTFTEVKSPKSNVSANSTTPAYSVVPLIFTRGGTRGGAFRLIRNRNRETGSVSSPAALYSIITFRRCQGRKTGQECPRTE